MYSNLQYITLCINIYSVRTVTLILQITIVNSTHSYVHLYHQAHTYIYIHNYVIICRGKLWYTLMN